MTRPKTLVLSAADVQSVLDMGDALRAVELAFAEHAAGRALMPPKVYLSLDAYAGDFRAMPSFIEASTGTAPLPAAAGVKWVNSHPENPKRHGLPVVMGVYVLSDPATALPLAILDATLLTAARTGAAAAVASRHLARPEPKTIGFVGAGVQSRWMLEAHRALYGDGFSVVAADLDAGAASELARLSGGRAGSVEEASGCDIVCTSTPGKTPVVRRAWVKPGTHINAMGADAPGKQELDAAILAEAIVVIDEHHQATHSGEVNVAIARGLYAPERIFATLGELLLGHKRLERRPDAVTLFDSTGLAVQDVALARVIHAAAKARGVGTEIELVAT